MAKKAHAFNMKVKYYNRNRLSSDEEQALGVSYCSTMKELLAVSDVFSICCPLNAQTTKLIGHAEFAQMKDGVFFINTARGPIVDEEALVAALESGKVERAGLDVFDGEPNIKYVHFSYGWIVRIVLLTGFDAEQPLLRCVSTMHNLTSCRRTK